VLQVLQEALTDELGAVHGYTLHAEMGTNRGYKALAGLTTKRAIEEMKHAERLMERILFLDGAPDVQSISNKSAWRITWPRPRGNEPPARPAPAPTTS
jgi:bacterioferritin